MTICGTTLVGRLGNNLNYCLACSSWNTSGPHLSQSTIRFSTTRRRWFIPFSNSSFLTASMWDVYFNFGDDEGEIDDWCFQQPFIVVGSLGSYLVNYLLKCGRKYEKIKLLKYFTFVACGLQSQKMASQYFLLGHHYSLMTIVSSSAGLHAWLGLNKSLH